MKTLLKSWILCAGAALRKSSVELDVKVDIMNMCFCLIRITKISKVEIEKTLKSLCDQVEMGIQNVILSCAPFSKPSAHLLGHRVEVKMELMVSCFHSSV